MIFMSAQGSGPHPPPTTAPLQCFSNAQYVRNSGAHKAPWGILGAAHGLPSRGLASPSPCCPWLTSLPHFAVVSSFHSASWRARSDSRSRILYCLNHRNNAELHTAPAAQLLSLGDRRSLLVPYPTRVEPTLLRSRGSYPLKQSLLQVFVIGIVHMLNWNLTRSHPPTFSAWTSSASPSTYT